jgi:hypothetical protein
MRRLCTHHRLIFTCFTHLLRGRHVRALDASDSCVGLTSLVGLPYAKYIRQSNKRPDVERAHP